MKIYVQLWQHFSDLFLEKGLFRTKFVKKVKTQIFLYIYIPSSPPPSPLKIMLLSDSVEKDSAGRRATNDNKIGRRKHAISISDNYEKTQTRS